VRVVPNLDAREAVAADLRNSREAVRREKVSLKRDDSETPSVEASLISAVDRFRVPPLLLLSLPARR